MRCRKPRRCVCRWFSLQARESRREFSRFGCGWLAQIGLWSWAYVGEARDTDCGSMKKWAISYIVAFIVLLSMCAGEESTRGFRAVDPVDLETKVPRGYGRGHEIRIWPLTIFEPEGLLRIHRPCDSSLPKERSYNSTDQSLFLVNPLAKRRCRLAHRLASVSVLSPRNPGEQRLGSHVPKNRAGAPVGNNRHVLTYSFTWMRTDHVFGCHGRFHCRNGPKQLTRNTIAKKQAGQEDTDSGYLFGNFLQLPSFRSAYALDRIQHSREQTFGFERREGLYGEPDGDLSSY